MNEFDLIKKVFWISLALICILFLVVSVFVRIN